MARGPSEYPGEGESHAGLSTTARVSYSVSIVSLDQSAQYNTVPRSHPFSMKTILCSFTLTSVLRFSCSALVNAESFLKYLHLDKEPSHPSAYVCTVSSVNVVGHTYSMYTTCPYMQC